MLRIFTWPLSLIGFVLNTVLGIVGGIFGFLLGICCVVLGGVLCATIIGALVGVPLLLFGLGLMLKSL
ncbi:MAG: hypothetical protein PHI98_11255 [Eubacteriales bacterium]|nr:hypothetical protein [Eubacteriales bacterium]